MRRMPAAVLVLGVLVGLMPGAMADQLPIPPLPPEHPVLGDNAPVPNVDAREPIMPVSSSPTVDVRFFRVKRYDPSQGFTPGSRYQSTEDRRAIQTPGLTVSVPLQ
jgi:hypothetical protein